MKRYANQTYDRIMGPIKDALTNKAIFKHDASDTDGIVANQLISVRELLQSPGIFYNSFCFGNHFVISLVSKILFFAHTHMYIEGGFFLRKTININC